MGAKHQAASSGTSTRQFDTRPQRGNTLIEACMVMAVTGVLVGATVPGLQEIVETRRVSGTAAQLATDIQWVRTEAVLRNVPVRLSFHNAADATCWVVHTGAAAQCRCDAPGPAVCTGGAEEIKTVRLPATEHVALQANVASMLFDPLHGTSTPTGTVRLVGARGREVQHVVNVMGRVRSCSPLGAVPGYRAC
jgi:type IV fimbrial biogenesis protein FimT